MDKRQRNRYVLAVYAVVASIAIILLILAHKRGPDFWQATFLNLATEFFGVVFIFFLVNFLFLVDDWGLSERIDKLISRLEISDRPSAKNFFGSFPDVGGFIQTSAQIDLCGVTLTSVINKQLSNLRERIKDGATIRILVIDPDSLAVQMSAARSENKDNIGYYKKRIEATFDDIEYLYRAWEDCKSQTAKSPGQGSFAVRLLSYSPSFGIFSFNSGKTNRSLFVELYPHHYGYGSPPVFSLVPARDGEWHSYFASQFEGMWQSALPWEAAKSKHRNEITES